MADYKIFEEKDAEICAISIDIIYKELGLQQVVQYLFSMLKNYYPITRVFCGFRVGNQPVFYPMADTLTNMLEFTKISPSIYNSIYDKDLVPRNSLEPYFAVMLRQLPEDYKHGIARIEDFNSQLRIPLFAQAERIFQLAICSDIPDIFQERDLALAKILRKKIAKSLLLQQQKLEEAYDDNTEIAKNTIQLLEMSRGLHSITNDIKKLATTDYTALIQGETGSGKDIVAQNIHELSVRKDKSFIKVNCGAINESLLESELFGYEKNAFTGANNSKKGFFEAGEGGSIFLDEIGELPLKLQTSLLRVIENKCIQKVGSNHEIPVDVRIIAATNKDLEKCVREGTFREDLWYRLNIYPIKVPPLRLHREDIPALVSYFVYKVKESLGIINIPKISEYEMNKLYDHSWPGNIRELKNIVERAAIKAKEGDYCQPLIFEIDYKEYHKTIENTEEKHFISMEEHSTNYVKQVLIHTRGKITGDNGAASILKLHPNTVRQYKHRLGL